MWNIKKKDERWMGMMSMFGRMKSMSADDFTRRSVEIPTMLASAAHEGKFFINSGAAQ